MHLQETLLYEILGDSKNFKVGSVDRGINVIKHRLCSKKILLILDDVDKLVQLETLAGDHDWFGLGSRIIITTRYQNLLTSHGVDSTYKMNELDHDKALQLFSLHPFQREKLIDDYAELTEDVVGYAGGLPLALTVLGSDLKGRSIHQWKSALDKLKRIPNKDIQMILGTSYEGLDDNEKDIFLDIACFFKTKDVDYVIKVLDSCGFFPDDGIPRLMDKCLINVDVHGKLWMHDLLQDMGREIVRQESPKEPGKRSRLWFHEDVRSVLEENTVTNKIEGILIDLPERDLICLGSKAFMKMKRLRIFINRNACLSGGPNYLSNELSLLDLGECPLQSMPSKFHGKKLIEFRMQHSLVKELGDGFKPKNLTIMTFFDCNFLEKIPDLSSSSNLKELRVQNCRRLVEGVYEYEATLFPEYHIPEWFSYVHEFLKDDDDGRRREKEEWVIDIEGPHYLEDISGIVLYLVMFFKDAFGWRGDIGYDAKITTNGSNHVCCIQERVLLVSTNGLYSRRRNMPEYSVWVGYSNLQSFELKVLDNLRVQFGKELFHQFVKAGLYKSCRAKVVYKNERRANKKRKMDEEKWMENL